MKKIMLITLAVACATMIPFGIYVALYDFCKRQGTLAGLQVACAFLGLFLTLGLMMAGINEDLKKGKP